MCTKKLQYGGPAFNYGSYPGPDFYRVTWKQGLVAFPAWHLLCKSIPTILPLNKQRVLWFTFDTQAKKLTTDKAF